MAMSLGLVAVSGSGGQAIATAQNCMGTQLVFGLFLGVTKETIWDGSWTLED